MYHPPSSAINTCPQSGHLVEHDARDAVCRVVRVQSMAAFQTRSKKSKALANSSSGCACRGVLRSHVDSMSRCWRWSLAWCWKCSCCCQRLLLRKPRTRLVSTITLLASVLPDSHRSRALSSGTSRCTMLTVDAERLCHAAMWPCRHCDVLRDVTVSFRMWDQGVHVLLRDAWRHVRSRKAAVLKPL